MIVIVAFPILFPAIIVLFPSTFPNIFAILVLLDIHDSIESPLARHNIPMFMTFTAENTPNKTVYVNQMRSAAASDTIFANDRLVKQALVLNDFEVVLAVSKPGYNEDLEELNDDFLVL